LIRNIEMDAKSKTRKILIVEDEEDMSEALKDKFELEKFKAYTAKNGEEGLKKSLDLHPDLILLDIVMPKMDGIEMLRRLRGDSWGKKAPVVILTNISDALQLTEAEKIGISAYLVKAEWGLKDVVTLVKEILMA
jgi:DNA-binding response OmpR family regulator